MLAPIDVILTSHERIAYNGPEGVFVANTHVSDFISALAKDPRMGTVPIVGVFNNDGSVFKVTIIPTHADDEQETFEFVKRIKELGHSHLDKEHITMAIAGPTSEYSDFTKGITDHLAFVFMFVASISFLILLVLFRSIVIPIKAVVMTILSTTAAYGVLVLVFQYGYAAHLLGFVSSGHITNWVPPFLFCILFGLSVDYEIFILAKTIEYKEIGESDADAITHAIADTAPIITTAAAIMIVTFICFMTNRLLPMKEVSLGLAVAIFIDATLVRLVLVPSLMVIAGKWNWWLPRWLDKILPRIHIRHH
jgi:RND superfamily putative drug exporter